MSAMHSVVTRVVGSGGTRNKNKSVTDLPGSRQKEPYIGSTRRKENSFWNLRLSEQSGQPKKLWQFISTLMGSGRTKAFTWDCPTARDLLDFFNEKIASVRRSTGGCPVKSAFKHSMVTFDEFEEYSEDDIRQVIMSSQSKSCALDPLPTTGLKEFLP